MRELDKRIANLRLRLAEIRSRQEQMVALERQFRAQLDKVLDFAVYERGDLDSALSMAEDIDTRLGGVSRASRHLETIRVRCQEELDALLLTSSIETAKAELAELEGRLREVESEMAGQKTLVATGQPEDRAEEEAETRRSRLALEHARIDAEIKQLRRTISEASDQAAKRVMSNE